MISLYVIAIACGLFVYQKLIAKFGGLHVSNWRTHKWRLLFYYIVFNTDMKFNKCFRRVCVTNLSVKRTVYILCEYNYIVLILLILHDILISLSSYLRYSCKRNLLFDIIVVYLYISLFYT